MASNRKLLVLPGDGIGPEVMTQVGRVIKWLGKRRAVGFDIQEDLVGGACYDAHGACSRLDPQPKLSPATMIWAFR